MKILIYGINYAPEITGIGKYSGEMAEWLAARGHQVEVITSMPYYPDWKIHKDYRGKGWFKQLLNKVLVRRSPFYVPGKVTGKSRIIHELSFLFSSGIWWLSLFFKKKADVVLAIYPPLIIGVFPVLYKKLRGVPLIVHIQDLQVDAAKDLGLIKNKTLLSLLVKTEKFILHNATVVSSISEGMKRKILSKGIKEEKYIMFPNWVDIDFIKPVPVEDSLRKELGLSHSDKIILYSGNIGEKQGLEILIPVAERLKSNPNVKIVIAGEGAGKWKLEEEVKARRLSNIIFLPLQPYAQLSRFLAIADAHLVLQKKAASDLLLPSKLISILASGGLAIVTAVQGTSLHEIVENNKIGLVIEPEDEKKLYEVLERVVNQDNSNLKERAREYAIRHLGRENILRNFENALERIT